MGSKGEGTAARGTRRGILAAAGAAVAGLVARQAARPVIAANGDSLRLGEYFTANNSTSLPTAFSYSGSAMPQFGAIFRVSDSNDPLAQQDGGVIVGESVRGIVSVGVAGIARGGYGLGVQGIDFTSSAQGVGIDALSVNGTGLSAESFGRYGVVSRTDLGMADSVGIFSRGGPNGIGVMSQTLSGTGTAVYGYSDAGTGVIGSTTTGPYGVTGASAASSNAVGVYGVSPTGYGVVGITAAGAPYSGITGGATADGAAAIAGGTSNPNAYAAYFTGKTVVQGDFTVVSGQKNAAVKHPDGTYRVLHCVESPEPWFEDFGEGTLANGTAEVRLDPDFAAVIEATHYHIFLTMYDTAHLLYVTSRVEAGFTVKAKEVDASGDFCWRVVARRKDLGKMQRLAKFTLPNIRIPRADDLPKPPTMPNLPDLPTQQPRPAPVPSPRIPAQPPAATQPQDIPVVATPQASGTGRLPVPLACAAAPTVRRIPLSTL